MTTKPNPIPDGYHTVTPYLIVNGAAKALDFYQRAFGATELMRMPGPGGKIMHAEIRIGNSRVMLNDVMTGKGPKAYGGSPASLWLYVEDADALFNRAVRAGAQVQMPLADQFWGDRGGAIADPEGYTWWVATRKEDLSRAEMEQRAAEAFKQMASTNR